MVHQFPLCASDGRTNTQRVRPSRARIWQTGLPLPLLLIRYANHHFVPSIFQLHPLQCGHCGGTSEQVNTQIRTWLPELPEFESESLNRLTLRNYILRTTLRTLHHGAPPQQHRFAVTFRTDDRARALVFASYDHRLSKPIPFTRNSRHYLEGAQHGMGGFFRTDPLLSWHTDKQARFKKSSANSETSLEDHCYAY